MPLKQVQLLRLASGTLGSPGSFRAPFAPSDSIGTPESRSYCYMPVAGIVRDLYFTTTSAPTAGNDATLTVRKGGVGTSLAAQIASGAIVGQDITNTVSFAAGDTINYAETGTGSGVGGVVSLNWTFIATRNKVSIYGGGDAGSVISTSVPSYMGVFTNSSNWQASAAPALSMSAIAGNIIAYTLGCAVAAGAAKSYTAYIYKSTDGGATFVKQDGTGGTVNTQGQVTGTSQLFANPTFTLPVSPGDMFYAEVTPAGTPTATRLHMVFAFEASNPNEYNISGTSAAFTNSANRFVTLNNYTGIAQSATEGNVESYGGYTAVKLDHLYVSLAAAPGTAASGKSINVRLRKGQQNAGATVTITDTAKTGNDTSTAAIEILKTDETCLAFTPTSSPTASVPVWAMRARTNPGGGPGKGRNARGAVKVIGSTQYLDWDFINYFGI